RNHLPPRQPGLRQRQLQGPLRSPRTRAGEAGESLTALSGANSLTRSSAQLVSRKTPATRSGRWQGATDEPRSRNGEFHILPPRASSRGDEQSTAATRIRSGPE